MSEVLRRARPVELTDDARFAGRIRRLAAVASVALGVIWLLAVTTLQAPPLVGLSLLAGWVSMPALLIASLARPSLRYALVVPASLVSLGLLAICVAWLPPQPIAAAGWVSIVVGVLLGGVAGVWFWFRLLPVPEALDEPFSTGRLALIALHVALIVAGIVLAATPLVGGEVR